MMSEDTQNNAVDAETTEAETAPVEPTPIEGGVEDVNHAAENQVTPEDQPDLPDAVNHENELIRQSVQALTDLTNFR